MQPFCDTHTIAFLKNWNSVQKPLDAALSDYFRSHKSLGSHDRKIIGENVYTLIRWKSLFDELDPSQNFSKRLHLLQKKPLSEWKSLETISLPARLGLTPYLWQQLTQNYTEETARSLAEILSSTAPIVIRANLLKTTREDLLKKWENKFQLRLSAHAPNALVFSKREPLFSCEEFRQGLFEVQDEGSQMIADLVQACPGQRVLDYCAGSGGKSLAFAPRMQGKGEIYLHDIRPNALKEASIRFRRAGVQNAQMLSSNHPTLSKLKNKMDWVLIDVPCSGTGTLRRNPDMKWKIDEAMIKRLQEEQRAIFQNAYSFVKPGAYLIYATCSILAEENEIQVAHFLKTYSLLLEKEPFKLLPLHEGPDGFFAAVFRKPKIE